MPKFIIETVATASIREFWTVEADDETDARNMLDDGDAELLFDEVAGDEENRSVATISPADHFAQMVREHHARMAGPDMLEALRRLVAQMECTSAWEDACAGRNDELLGNMQDAYHLITAATGNA